MVVCDKITAYAGGGSFTEGNMEKSIVCEECGQIFIVKYPCRYQQRFCSKKCRGKWQSRERSGINHPLWNKKQIECEICGIIFIVKPCQANNARFCSRKCDIEWRKTEWKSGPEHHLWKGGKSVEKRCELCGQIFYLYPSDSHQRFCSRKCAHKFNIGENSPRWKGGYDGSYGPLWRKQRKKARERDKVCQRCDMTAKDNGQELDVHHIIPFREFGISRAKEAHHLSNLICYCVSCHQIIEGGKQFNNDQSL